MKLSIVIPIYNSIKNLQRCLDSVLESQISDLECILVNDGSTDSCEVLCKTYADADRRFIYIQKDRGGTASAKNSGLIHSRGKYVMFLSPDDYMLKDGWDKIAEVLQQESMDLHAFTYQFQNTYGETVFFKYPINGEKSSALEDIWRMTFTTDVFKMCTGILFDYEIIRKMKLKFQLDNPVYEDIIFISEYLKYCTTGQLLNRPILVHQESIKDMESFSSIQRVSFLENMYRFQEKETVHLWQEIQASYTGYYVEKITEIMEDLSKNLATSDLKDSIADILHHEFIQEFLSKTDGKELCGIRDRLFLAMMKKGKITLLSWLLHTRIKHEK